MTQGRFVQRTLADGVLHLRLNRPDRLNAVSEEVYAALEQALAGVDEDPQVRAVRVDGAGRAFCAGADLKAHAERRRTAAEQRAYVWAGQRVCRTLQRLPQPVVVAVHGYALGAGAEIALSGDVVVAAEDAIFGFPEVGLGTFVGGGISQRLPQLIGQARASELLLLGRRLSGREALEWGLIARAVPLEELEDHAASLAEQLAGHPRRSVQLAKSTLREVARGTLDQALAVEAEALLACMGTDDWQQGVSAFEARADQGGDGSDRGSGGDADRRGHGDGGEQVQP